MMDWVKATLHTSTEAVPHGVRHDECHFGVMLTSRKPHSDCTGVGSILRNTTPQKSE